MKVLYSCGFLGKVYLKDGIVIRGLVVVIFYLELFELDLLRVWEVRGDGREGGIFEWFLFRGWSV